MEDVRHYASSNAQFEAKLQELIRMGIIIFKIFIWGVISSDIRSEIMFYGSTRASPYN